MTAPSRTSADVFLSAAHLSHTYDGQTVPALTDVSFSLTTEKLVAVIGPDGAGKSTLLHLLSGLLAPAEGVLSVAGLVPDPDDPAFVTQLGFMPQTFGLYGDLTVIENFRLFAGLRGLSRKDADARAEKLLTLTGLRPFYERRAGALSGGMKQKLGVACALSAEPAVILLDEPTAGVDPLSRRELRRLIETMCRAPGGPRCLFATAAPEEARGTDRVLLLDHGRLVRDMTPEALAAESALCTFSLPLAADVHVRRKAVADVCAVDAASPWLDALPAGDRLRLLLADGAAVPADAQPREAIPEDTYNRVTLADETPGAEAGMLPDDAGGRAAADDTPVISVKGLRRLFGSFTAVDNTTFDVKRGEIFGLLGPNGAGKTTTFRMLCGLLKPSAGTIEVAGADILRETGRVRERIGYVAQKFSLYARLSVRQNLTYFGRSYGLNGARLKTRIETLLADFDLVTWADTPSGGLPGGARRRLAMACGLIHEPEILFLDEATSGADTAARRAFWRRINALAESGTTVVVTTHLLEEAEYCDRLLIQDAGRVIALGTPEAVRRQGGTDGKPAEDIEAAFIAIVERERRAAEEGRGA